MKKTLLSIFVLFSFSFLAGCAWINQAQQISWLMSDWQELLSAENYSGALAAFNTILEIDSNFADAYAQRWYVELLQWELEKGMGTLSKSLEINPDSLMGLTNMWIAQSLQWNFDTATTFLDKALAIDSAYAPAWLYKWNSVADAGNLEEAIQYYNKAIAIDPEWYLTWFNKWTVLADIWYNTKDDAMSNEAINHYRQALTLNPEYHIANIFEWISFFDQQKYDDALSAINLWLIQLPENTTWLYYKWLTLSQLERFEDAKIVLENVLELNPGYGYAQQELDRIAGR